MRRVQVIVSVVVLAAGVAAPAAASGPERLPQVAVASEPTAERPHCVVTAQEERNTAPVTPLAPRCFATFADAIFEATNGAVVLPADAQTVSQETLDAARNGSNAGPQATVIGIEYQHSGYRGWSYVIQSTNGNGCLSASFRISQLPSSRDNQISSALTYSGCRSTHYSGANLTGSRIVCKCSQMGSMNDRTTSIRFA